MENNCSNCKFKKTVFSDLEKPSVDMVHAWDTFYVQCLAGYNEEILEFYTKNKGIPSNEVDDELVCFTQTKIAKDIDKLIKMADNILDKIK